jgi:hypothetical protein
LVPAGYLTLNRLEDARKLFAKNPEECSWNTLFAWGRVLERFLSGDAAVLRIIPFDAFKGKSAVPGVDRKDLNVLSVSCPPASEQTAIVQFLADQLAKLDALMSKVRMAMERLQEYRTALISAAVTGQIDPSARADAPQTASVPPSAGACS